MYESGETSKIIAPEKFRLNQAEKEPSIILAKNFIGPPSVTIHKNDGQHYYDAQLKWLVDIDMYRRRMDTDKLVYINELLVNVYVSASQVTSYTKNIGEVEIPEHFYFLEKMGIKKLENVMVYDYNWRLIRNFNIKAETDIRNCGYRGSIHPVIKSGIAAQRKIPHSLLKNGIVSKTLMLLHFLKNKGKIK